MFFIIFFGFLLTEPPFLSEAHQRIVTETFARLDDVSTRSDFGEMVLSVGRGFLGSAYLAHSLDGPGPERLVVNLEGFDCLTLVENCLALARAYELGANPDGFADRLRRIRYRHGVLDGYPSRLHYSLDWARDNAAKGFLRDITRDLGGVPYEKTINFMSQHRAAYPSLSNDAFFQAILATETLLNRQQAHYIPKQNLPRAEAAIANGDILLITTSVQGLDVAHMGFALKKRNGSLHMLHASQKSGLVEITPKPFFAYLEAHANHTGVVVLRPMSAPNHRP